jgi:hypothetical protein
MPSEVEQFVIANTQAYMAAHYDGSKLGYAVSRVDKMWQMLVADDNEPKEFD